MARVTVEDCVDKVDSPYELVLVAKERATQLNSGIEPTLDRDNDKNPVVSLREIACEAIDADSLQERFIRSMQKNLIKEENDTENEASLEEEFAAYLNETETEKKVEEDFMVNKNKLDDDNLFVDVSEEFLKNED